MKINLISTILVLFGNVLFVSGQKLSLEIQSIADPDPEIEILTPINRLYFEANTKKYVLDKNYKLQLEIDSIGPGTVQLTKSFSNLHILYLGGDEHYTLKFMGERQPWKIEGTNAEGQLLFNRLFRDNTRTRYAKLDSIPKTSDRVAYVSQLIEIDIQKFRILLDSGKISKPFFEEVEKQADVYYRLLLATDMFFISQGFSEPKIDFDSTHLEVLKNAVSVISDKWVQSSHLYPALLDRYISYLKLQAKSEGKDIAYSLQKYGENYGMYCINLIRQQLDVEKAEIPWATFMVMGIINNLNEKEWLSNFESFKNLYPNSPLINKISPLVDNVRLFHSRLEERNSSVNFIENSDSIEDFEELGLRTKGKITYVDLWATWCVPCREELQYSIKLHNDFEKIGVQPLYLSIDVENKAQAWKNMVRGLELKGLNMRASTRLNKNLNQLVPKFTGIPRYIILNKDGKVVNWDAKRPSDGQALLDQLKSIH